MSRQQIIEIHLPQVIIVTNLVVLYVGSTHVNQLNGSVQGTKIVVGNGNVLR